MKLPRTSSEDEALGGQGITPGLGDPVAEQLLGESRERAHHEPREAEARAEAAAGVAFLATALAMAIVLPRNREIDPVSVAALIVAWAATWRIEYEIGTGYTTPTMLVLVPMLYLLPPSIVPLCVAGGYLLSRLVDAFEGRRHITRSLVVFSLCWHAVGPALVFVAAGIDSPSFSDWPVLLVALATSILGDAVASLLIDRFGLRVPVKAVIGTALWVYLVDILLAPLGFVTAYVIDQDQWAGLALFPLWALLLIFARERSRRLDAALELSRTYRGTAMLLGEVIEATHEYTGTHSRDVVELAVRTGERLGLDPVRLRRLEFGALLHDVGKITVPDAILNKPGPLTRDERDVMDLHTVAGQEMLEAVGGALGEAGRIVRASHERWDGTGYPDRMTGEEIPLEARIIACCDAWSAMTSDRAYRRALTRDEALAELHRGVGTQFDPAVARVVESIVVSPPDRPLRLGAASDLLAAARNPHAAAS